MVVACCRCCVRHRAIPDSRSERLQTLPAHANSVAHQCRYKGRLRAYGTPQLSLYWMFLVGECWCRGSISSDVLSCSRREATALHERAQGLACQCASAACRLAWFNCEAPLEPTRSTTVLLTIQPDSKPSQQPEIQHHLEYFHESQ
jgi:hypothetical protein